MVGMTWATFPLNLVERVTLFSKLPKQDPQKLLAILTIWTVRDKEQRSAHPLSRICKSDG